MESPDSVLVDGTYNRKVVTYARLCNSLMGRLTGVYLVTR